MEYTAVYRSADPKVVWDMIRALAVGPVSFTASGFGAVGFPHPAIHEPTAAAHSSSALGQIQRDPTWRSSPERRCIGAARRPAAGRCVHAILSCSPAGP